MSIGSKEIKERN